MFRVARCELSGDNQTNPKSQIPGPDLFYVVRLKALNFQAFQIGVIKHGPSRQGGPKSSHGQSFEGQKNDPRLFLASFQNETAANGSPSMGYRIILTGTFGGRALTASLK